MKLNECTFGRMVITKTKEVGHVVGLTYNTDIRHTGGLPDQELFDRTIPIVKFASGERGIHQGNLSKFQI